MLQIALDYTGTLSLNHTFATHNDALLYYVHLPFLSKGGMDFGFPLSIERFSIAYLWPLLPSILHFI